MKCPKCNRNSTRVIDLIPVNNPEGIKRRRECNMCGERWTTYEYSIEEHEMISVELKRHKRKVNALARQIIALQEIMD